MDLRFDGKVAAQSRLQVLVGDAVQYDLVKLQYYSEHYLQYRGDYHPNKIRVVVPSDAVVQIPAVVIETLAAPIALSAVPGLELHITLANLAVFGALYCFHFDDGRSPISVLKVVFDSNDRLRWVTVHQSHTENQDHHPKHEEQDLNYALH